MRSREDGFNQTQNIVVYGSRLFLMLSSMAGTIAHINHTKTAIPDPKARVDKLSQIFPVRTSRTVAASIVPSKRMKTDHVQSKNTFLPIKPKAGSRTLRQTLLTNLTANRTTLMTRKRIDSTPNVETIPSTCELATESRVIPPIGILSFPVADASASTHCGEMPIAFAPRSGVLLI
jgi:hypothetical protein